MLPRDSNLGRFLCLLNRQSGFLDPAWRRKRDP